MIYKSVCSVFGRRLGSDHRAPYCKSWLDLVITQTFNEIVEVTSFSRVPYTYTRSERIKRLN